jgi:hypothetical protein
MATKRKTANDYRIELFDIRQEKQALENRIIARAKELCKQYPDIWVLLSGCVNANKTGDFVKVEKLHVVTALNLIEFIEKELANQHPHKQLKLYDEVCKCDGRDMPVYEEDGKRWCPQCGYEVK